MKTQNETVQKKYEKPKMDILEISSLPELLCGSQESGDVCVE